MPLFHPTTRFILTNIQFLFSRTPAVYSCTSGKGAGTTSPPVIGRRLSVRRSDWPIAVMRATSSRRRVQSDVFGAVAAEAWSPPPGAPTLPPPPPRSTGNTQASVASTGRGSSGRVVRPPGLSELRVSRLSR